MTTLYVTEQGAVVNCRDGRVVVRKGERVLGDLPAGDVERLVLFGNAHLTTPTVAFLLERGIDAVYLSQSGRYRGRLQSPLTGDAAVRQKQYALWTNSPMRLTLARRFVEGKTANMAALCRRQRGSAAGIAAVQALEGHARRAAEARDVASLRGHEGAATAAYFKALRTFLRPELGFEGRNHRPPRDPANALLSLGYTLLYGEFLAHIEATGLDPYLGFFHETRRGHAALASDLMEEWRPVIVDSLVLFVTSRGEFTPSDFARQDDGGLWLTREGLKRFLARYDARLARRVHHPSLKQHLTYRQCIAAQVRQLVAIADGRRSDYEPFRSR